MSDYFIRRYDIFIERTGGTDEGIKNYIGIEDNRIKLNAKKCNASEETIIIDINYFDKIEYINFNLPKEINDIINSYCGNFIELKLKLECYTGFPFVSPMWSLINIKHNLLNNTINIQEYYLWIIENINQENSERNGWTPIYGFDKELLRFFTRINHFDILENYY